jgi:3-oxoacyl-[acyl-carrier protein] reductase
MDVGVSAEDLLGLKGKNALVTGGSRGVGRATAILLARAGVNVGFGYRSRRADADATLAELRGLGVDAWAEPGDLADREDVERLFARVDRSFDGLDVFVCNHGIWPPEDVPIEEMTDARWRRTLEVNLDSAFTTTRNAARRLRDDGRIVLVSSTAGQRGEAFHVDYAATKGALISMVKGLCVELGPRGITVNSVAPGWIDTEMADPAFGEGGRESIAATIPIGRIATAEDVAGPILFLCSRLGRHVTGEILNVNGGAVLVG